MADVNERALARWMNDVQNRLMEVERRLEAAERELRRRKGGRPKKGATS